MVPIEARAGPIPPAAKRAKSWTLRAGQNARGATAG